MQGYSPSGIMDKLFISKGCVNSHMVNIYHSLGIEREKGKDMKMLAVLKYTEAKQKEQKELLRGQYLTLLDRYNSLLKEIKNYL